jgi:hypothetical protein
MVARVKGERCLEWLFMRGIIMTPRFLFNETMYSTVTIPFTRRAQRHAGRLALLRSKT